MRSIHLIYLDCMNEAKVKPKLFAIKSKISKWIRFFFVFTFNVFFFSSAGWLTDSLDLVLAVFFFPLLC